MEDNKAGQVRENLKSWISLDDEERQLRAQIKAIREQKQQYSSKILDFIHNKTGHSLL